MANSTAMSKTERLEIRLRRSQKQKIAEAARLNGKTLSEFVSSTLDHAASRVIEEQQTVKLSRRAAEAFVKLLMNPPPANQRLRRAARLHGDWERKGGRQSRD
jgi:uncharacterized protein (DUF1778 family)